MPFLGDLPLVGPLFRSDSRTRTKSNLMVFLRPMIIRNQEDSNALSMDRYDLIRAAQQGVGPAAAERDHADQRCAGGADGAAAQTPGTPFRNGEVPRPLSWPESVAGAARVGTGRRRAASRPNPPARPHPPGHG